MKSAAIVFWLVLMVPMLTSWGVPAKGFAAQSKSTTPSKAKKAPPPAPIKMGPVTGGAVGRRGELPAVHLVELVDIVAVGADVADGPHQQMLGFGGMRRVAVEAGVLDRHVGHLELEVDRRLEVVVTHEAEAGLGIGQLDGRAAVFPGELVAQRAVVGDRLVYRGHPIGEVFVRFPNSDVGEYCPFVRP